MLEMEQVNDINRRIRLLRKDDLKLSQEEFANRINLSQRAVSTMETSGSRVTDRNLKTICEKFNVNEKWLRTGEGEMFNQSDKNLIDEVAQKYNLSEGSRALMETFLTFNAEQQEMILQFIDEFTARWSARKKTKPQSPQQTQAEINEEIAEILKKYLSLDEQSKEKIKSDLDYEYERTKTFAEESSDAAT